MKKSNLINGPISSVIAHLGHNDMLTIADAGLPIPSTTRRIDLALTKGMPGFTETLKIVLAEMYVERAIVSEDIKTISPDMFREMQEILSGIPIDTVPHTEFKQMTGTTRAIVRTGEFTPYANVILVAGAWGFNL